MRRRIKVAFDDRSGITHNLSAQGMSIAAPVPFQAGERVRGRLLPPEADPIDFEADVMWVRKPRNPRSLDEQHTMGLQFLQRGEGYGRLIGEPEKVALPIRISGRPVATPVPFQKPAKTRRSQAARRVTRPPTRPPDRPAIELLTGIAPGMESKAGVAIAPADLAAPPDVVATSIAPLRAAGWLERGALAVVGPHLPRTIITVPLSTHMDVLPAAPLQAGTVLTVLVRLTEIGPSYRWLRFEGRIVDGARHVATGTHVRQVIDLSRRRRT